MRIASTRLVYALPLATLVGCSALGLDRIPIPTCDSSDDCAVLNDADRIAADACQRYFCDAAPGSRGVCRIAAEDYDRDGVPKCGVALPDCDDRDANVSPMGAELACNGLDDDCDAIIDEGVFALPATVAVASLGEARNVSFAPGADGVSAVVWNASAGVGMAARLGGASSVDPARLQYRTNARSTAPASDGIRNASFAGEADGCLLPSSGAIACPSSGTCDGPGTNGLPWLAGLPGDGHVCRNGGCDACTDDAECMPNTLPRTCDRTDTASACSPRAAGAQNCCQGQALTTGANPVVGGDAAACCRSLPRACHAGMCRDTCSSDSDCPVVAFELGTELPIFGVCVQGACLPPGRPDIEGPSGSCEVDGAALDRASTSWLVASVNSRGCAAGQLRLGVSAEETPTRVLSLGPESRSNVFAGVDVDVSALLCTGASRASGIVGAAQPSAAALPGVGAGVPDDPAQGVVAYLAAARGSLAACADATSREVEVIGAHFARTTTLDRAFVQGTDDGTPTAVGATRGVGPPGLAAIPERGWVIGFGDGATPSGSTLRVIPALAPLPALAPSCAATSSCASGLECIGATQSNPGSCRARCATDADCGTDALICCASAAACGQTNVGYCAPSQRGHVARGSVPLRVFAPLRGPTAGTGTVDHVQLAAGSVSANVVDLGVAWQEGCGSTAKVFSAVVRVDVASGSLVSSGTPLEVGAGTNPVIAYVGEGVLTAGRAAADGSTADASSDGGFVVAWRTDDARIVARRMGETGARILDPVPVRLDIPGSAGVPARPHLFASNASDHRLEYAYAEGGTTAAVYTGAMSCRAP